MTKVFEDFNNFTEKRHKGVMVDKYEIVRYIKSVSFSSHEEHVKYLEDEDERKTIKLIVKYLRGKNFEDVLDKTADHIKSFL